VPKTRGTRAKRVLDSHPATCARRLGMVLAARRFAASKPDEKFMTVNHSQHGLASDRDVLPVFCQTHGLSQREREVLDLLIAGRSPKEIAGELCIAASTVRFHAVGLYKKCSVSGQREMLALVARVVLRAGHA
jgi:DNA-binding NarL/FixJ family response regulator